MNRHIMIFLLLSTIGPQCYAARFFRVPSDFLVTKCINTCHTVETDNFPHNSFDRPVAPKSTKEITLMLQEFSDQLSHMWHENRGSVAALHNWESAARIDQGCYGIPAWINLGSSKGTGNATSLKITNHTLVCIHTHPKDSIVEPSYNDQERSKLAYEKLCEHCLQLGLSKPEPIWMVTLHESGQICAWRLDDGQIISFEPEFLQSDKMIN